MKNIFQCFIFVFALLSVLSVTAENTPGKLRLGFSPGGSLEETQRGVTVLSQALQDELGLPIEAFVFSTPEKLLSAIESAKVDFAFITALSYVMAEEKTALKVLLKKMWETPYYYSVILAHPSSTVRSLSDLPKAKLAFVDQKSTSGYLYPLAALLEKNLKLSPDLIRFSGSHEKSVALLEAKSVQAIAVFSDDKRAQKSAFQKYSKSKIKPRLIWSSDPIPNDPFVVLESFYKKYPMLSHRVMAAIIDVTGNLNSNKDFKLFMGVHGFVPATSKQYDPVRNLNKFVSSKEGPQI
jgi:phosphonate transport system substrate-binding protein